jgi:GntR family transcriptional regulator, arabinose operon transcriptional repressor
LNKVTDLKISHESLLSLHIQIHNRLRQLILSERWPNGSRVPSETQLQRHLNISRSTIRLALQQAELEGLIERVAGKGTFVAYTPRPKPAHPNFLAFVTSNFDCELQRLMLSGAESETRTRGYRIIFCNSQDSPDERELLDQLRADDIGGIMLWPSVNKTNTAQLAEIYGQTDLPVVMLDRRIDGVECDFVSSDNYTGAYEVVKHLIDQGHREIVFLTHRVTNIITVQERLRAYRDAMQHSGLTPLDPWFIGETNQEIAATQSLQACSDRNHPHMVGLIDYLSKSPVPTAIFGLNDYMALMAMKAAQYAGYRVPDDISIAGFDDINLSVYIEIPLTTVTQNAFNIGKRAAQMLLERIEGSAAPPHYETIPTQLRVRMSTKKLVSDLERR